MLSLTFSRAAVALLLFAAPVADDQSAESELSPYFGFGPLQMYKLKQSIGLLKLADLNNDGLTDIAVWNSYQSRIEILYQPNPDAPQTGGNSEQELERNELPNRGDMRLENVPVAYRIADMDIGEFTGDKLNDIVFFGANKQLVILAGKPGGGFERFSRQRAPQGSPRGASLAIGDYNHDGRQDVAILGDEVLLLFHQKPGGGLAKAQRLVHNIESPLMLLAADINGDGRDDLAIDTNDEINSVHVRIQNSDGRLGAQQAVRIPMLRSMTFAPAPGGADLYAIEHATGRLKHYRWTTPKSASGDTDWPKLLYGYPTVSRGKQRPVAVGDVTGDGLVDVVAADPAAAQLVLFKQIKGGGLQPGIAFPGLVKTLDVQIADIDGDGVNEVISVSAEEKMVGVSRFKDGRLTFPAPFRVQDEPYAAAFGARKVGDKPHIAAFVAKRERKFSLIIASLGTAADDSETSHPLEDLEDDPAGVRFADVNQDGLNDLLVFVRFGALRTFIQQEGGAFELLSGAGTREGLVKEAPLAGFAMADVTGDGKPEVLLAQKGLARALVVRGGQWTVVDQYNPENADAEISGLAVLPGKPGSPTLVMYDRKSNDLLVFNRRADKTYGVEHTMPVGSFKLTAMTAAPIAAEGGMAVILADAKSLAVLTPRRAAATFVEQHSYETKVKDAWLFDSVPADVNHDGVRDVIVVDGQKANIEVLTTRPNGDLVRVLRFQVFQGKQFSQDPSGRREPREILAGDVTGDGIDDIVVVVHDRIIVYPGQ